MRGEVIVLVVLYAMVFFSRSVFRVHVDGSVGKILKVVKELMSCLHCHLVSLLHREVGTYA